MMRAIVDQRLELAAFQYHHVPVEEGERCGAIGRAERLVKSLYYGRGCRRV